jgi:hypothetical protein
MIGRTPPSVIQAVGREVDTVFTNVEEVERAVADAVYIPMAVDTDFYRWRPRRFDEGAVRLVFAGADSDRKGLGTLLLAYDRLPADRFHLTVVGPHERHAHQLARSNIDVVGWSSPEQLREIYWRSHIFVSPATTETQNPDELGMVDGFPTTTGSDAMATGCALVASNPRNERRALQPGVHYADVRVDDVENLARVLLALEEDRNRIAALAEHGSRRVAGFSIARVVNAKLRTMGIGPHGLPRPTRRRVDLTTTSGPQGWCAERWSAVAATRARAKVVVRTGVQRAAAVALRPTIEAQVARDASIAAQLESLQCSVSELGSQLSAATLPVARRTKRTAVRVRPMRQRPPDDQVNAQ